jgi:hypothetical protein
MGEGLALDMPRPDQDGALLAPHEARWGRREVGQCLRVLRVDPVQQLRIHGGAPAALVDAQRTPCTRRARMLPSGGSISAPTAAAGAPGRCGTSTGSRRGTGRGGVSGRVVRTSDRRAGRAGCAGPVAAPRHGGANTCSRAGSAPGAASGSAAHSACTGAGVPPVAGVAGGAARYRARANTWCTAGSAHGSTAQGERPAHRCGRCAPSSFAPLPQARRALAAVPEPVLVAGPAPPVRRHPGQLPTVRARARGRGAARHLGRPLDPWRRQ